MCGRFKIDRELDEIIRQLDLKLGNKEELFQPNFNASPGQVLPIITEPNELQFAKWGLIPSWAKDAKMTYKTFNAKAETLLEKATYKNLIKGKRCLVPTTGFYEWKEINKKKQPYLFTAGKDYTMLAGLWDYNPQFNLKSFTVITCEPNDFMKDYHNRMPVILNEESGKKWLSDITVEEALTLLKPCEEDIVAEESNNENC